ncbi:GumC family protein [Methylopila sp. M107]|uniref:GumC family protein n=1 Tax=Methylopila sp. M107 TaxID=1101190 RepID=UPI0003A5F081|nr:GumC family protein [Methylopila sp. M107]
MSSRTTNDASRGAETRGPAVWGEAASQVGASLKRAALLICVLALTGAVAGPLLLSLVPPSFRATAQLVIDPRGLQVFPGEQGGPVLDANAGVNFVETQLQLLTSERVLARVARADKDRPASGASAAPEPDGLGLRPSLNPDGPAEQRAITALRRSLTIKRGERSFVVDVTAKAATADRAAWIANAVVKAFMEEDSASRAQSGRRLNEEMGGRLQALRDQLTKSEAKAEAFRAEHGLVSSGNDRLVSEQRLEQAVADLGSAQDRASRAAARVSQLDSASFDVGSLGPLTAAEDMRTISFLIERLSAAQESLADARLQLGPRHPTFESARSRVDTIERRIRSEISRIREAEKANLNRARSELEAGKRNVSDLSAAVTRDRKAWGDLRALYAEVKANQDVLATFESRSREADEYSRVTPTSIRVASAATPEQGASRLVLAVAMAIAGAVIGAMLGVALAALWACARPVNRVAPSGARPPERPEFQETERTREDTAAFRRRFTVHPSGPG